MAQPEQQNPENKEAVHDIVIIGFAGPLGAGKSTAAKLLESNFGFPHFSISSILRRLALAQNLKEPITRELLDDIYGKLVDQQGEGAAVKFANELIDSYQGTRLQKFEGATIDGIRYPHEAEKFKQYPNSYLIVIDAPTVERFERVIHRERVGDITNWKDFSQRDAKDQERLKPVFEMADLVIHNNGNPEELEQQLLHFIFEKTNLF